MQERKGVLKTSPTVEAGHNIAGRERYLKIVETKVSRLRAIMTRNRQEEELNLDLPRELPPEEKKWIV